MGEDTSFEELMRRVRAGDGAAAEQLVRCYEPTIRRVVRVRLADARLQRLFDSMDICQSVFGSFFVHAALGDYDLGTPEQLLGLLVTMSRKKLVDQSRRAGAARRDYRRTREAADGREKQWAADDPSPSRQVAGQELLEEFRRRLTDAERQIADRRSAGLNWQEVAAELGGKPDALRKQLARGVERVSRELGLEPEP
jgi:RNA polymerase sigma-70 factor (ECF subfamily)